MKVVSRPVRVVIVGGAGVFGGRLAGLLARDSGFEVVIAGRSLSKAQSAAARLGAQAVQLDRETATADQVAELTCDAVVDCSGPFVMDVPEPYRLAEAALAAGSHYLDIADGRDFVCQISRLDLAARRVGKVALSGASTTPALSSAVCDELVRGWQRVDQLELGVTPGNRAPRGLAVVRSILAYAGRPVRVFRDGAWSHAPGWGLLSRADLAPDIRGRWLSLCDTADLEIFPARYGVRDRVLFRGGLELAVLHLGLTAASQIVRLGLLPGLSLFAEMARDLADMLIRYGTDRGGMIVDANGLDATGSPVARRWSLIAEGGDGPNIPILAAYACLKKLEHISPGARPCLGEVTLPEFDALFKMFRIRTSVR